MFWRQTHSRSSFIIFDSRILFKSELESEFWWLLGISDFTTYIPERPAQYRQLRFALVLI